MSLVMPELEPVADGAPGRFARYLALNGLRPEEIRAVLRDEFDLDTEDADEVLDRVS